MNEATRQMYLVQDRKDFENMVSDQTYKNFLNAQSGYVHESGKMSVVKAVKTDIEFNTEHSLTHRSEAVY